MKRMVILLLLMFVMVGFVFAQGNLGAQNRNGNNGAEAYYNCPYPDCPLCISGVYGPRANKGSKGMVIDKPVIVTSDQAKNAVEKYIQNLKGYYIESVETFNRAGKGMQAYRVYVKDGSGNSFFFHVDPWGRVGGPVAYTRTK